MTIEVDTEAFDVLRGRREPGCHAIAHSGNVVQGSQGRGVNAENDRVKEKRRCDGIELGACEAEGLKCNR